MCDSSSISILHPERGGIGDRTDRWIGGVQAEDQESGVGRLRLRGEKAEEKSALHEQGCGGRDGYGVRGVRVVVEVGSKGRVVVDEMGRGSDPSDLGESERGDGDVEEYGGVGSHWQRGGRGWGRWGCE